MSATLEIYSRVINCDSLVIFCVVTVVHDVTGKRVQAETVIFILVLS